MKACGNCGSTSGACPECGKVYPFNPRPQARCGEPECVSVNAPVDCKCGFVVSMRGNGTLDLDMNLIPWKETP